MCSRVACSASFWPVGFCLAIAAWQRDYGSGMGHSYGKKKAADDVRDFSILREAQKELKIK